MNWKKKLMSKTFWISLAGAVVVMLQCFGLKIDAPYINEAISAVCSVCIILGLMRDDSPTLPPSEDESENEEENEENESENEESEL